MARSKVRAFLWEWLLKSVLLMGTVPAALALEYLAGLLR